MIIHKNTKSVETRSDIPNVNFGNYDDVFVVDDNSELGIKIIVNQPYFDLVIGVEGNLIDITPTGRPLEPIPKPKEIELLKNQLKTTQSAVDYLLLSQTPLF